MKRVTVVFENEWLLILNKPAGLAVQGGKGVKVSLDELLAAEYSPRPLLVHRLDRDTSGLVLVARNREAAGILAPLFSGKEGEKIRKRYVAVCAGVFARKEGDIRERIFVRGSERDALTSYTVLEDNGEFSLAALELRTGRMHQIRRHLARLGNPVLGDGKYGDFSLNKRLGKTMGLRRLLLHAAALGLPPLPRLGIFRPLGAQAPLPGYFAEFCEREFPGYPELLPAVPGR
ncbi:MAG: RluA family pseudouridine synthase [Treponema sp.]|nr:RluA family pseudouridine synthase [Treponema sp.]